MILLKNVHAKLIFVVATKSGMNRLEAMDVSKIVIYG